MSKLTGQFLPRFVQNIVHESLARHRVFASVAGGTTEKHDFSLADNGDRVSKSSLGYFAVDFQSLDDLGHVWHLATSHRLTWTIVAGSLGKCILPFHNSVTGVARGTGWRSLLLTAKGDRHRSSLGGTLGATSR